VPTPELTPQETRLASFCRLLSAVYFGGALSFAAFPTLTFRIATLDAAADSSGPAATFWSVLAVGMMTALGTACLVVAARPRERRHAILPVAAAKLTCSALAAVHLLAGERSAALLAVIVADLPLFALTLAVYRAAAPGVHSAPAREAPPAEEQPKIQLKISKP